MNDIEEHKMTEFQKLFFKKLIKLKERLKELRDYSIEMSKKSIIDDIKDIYNDFDEILKVE